MVGQSAVYAGEFLLSGVGPHRVQESELRTVKGVVRVEDRVAEFTIPKKDGAHRLDDPYRRCPCPAVDSRVFSRTAMKDLVSEDCQTRTDEKEELPPHAGAAWLSGIILCFFELELTSASFAPVLIPEEGLPMTSSTSPPIVSRSFLNSA